MDICDEREKAMENPNAERERETHTHTETAQQRLLFSLSGVVTN